MSSDSDAFAVTVAQVQASWVKATPISSETATLFYQNLFALDPGLRRLFKGDMREQGARFTQMLSFAIARLTDLDVLMPVLHKLGQDHAGHGVTLLHYDLVGLALLQTLDQVLGKAFTPDVHDAWKMVYDVIARTMIEGAAMPRAAEPPAA